MQASKSNGLFTQSHFLVQKGHFCCFIIIIKLDNPLPSIKESKLKLMMIAMHRLYQIPSEYTVTKLHHLSLPPWEEGGVELKLIIRFIVQWIVHKYSYLGTKICSLISNTLCFILQIIPFSITFIVGTGGICASIEAGFNWKSLPSM